MKNLPKKIKSSITYVLENGDPSFYICVIILAVFQILDGALTYIGVTLHGTTAVEGNVLIRNLMDTLGNGPALILAKGAAFSLCVCMFFIAPERNKTYMPKIFDILIDVFVYIITLIYFAVVVVWVVEIIKLLK